jgi:hypothetical protein
MARPPKFDHDEAYARWQAGETFAELALAYDVTDSAVYQVVKRRDPEWVAAHNRYHREWQRKNYRQPCVRGCGRLAWWTVRTNGRCRECFHAERRAEADARDNHGTESRYSRGCRCPECRAQASDAKRRRREASRVPCSHGCGTLVDSINRSNPEKPPECNPCCLKRLRAEGVLGRRKVAV